VILSLTSGINNVAAATFDKSRELNLYARIGETGVPITLNFVNEDLTNHAIASYDFKLRVKRRPFSTDYLFELGIGSGLTIVDTNKLQIELNYAQSLQKEDTYFYTLYSEDEDHTWLNGAFPMFKGIFDGVANEVNQVVVSSLGNSVTVTISNPSITDDGLVRLQGTWDASGNVPPSVDVFRGFLWVISVPGTLMGVSVEKGAKIMALATNPGTDLDNWDLDY